METGWQIAFIVLQVVFLGVIGYFISGLKTLESKMRYNSKRIDELEIKHAVSNVKDNAADTAINKLELKMDKLIEKVDYILAPDFFQRCPVAFTDREKKGK